ncbi:hypothetical protein RCL_jg17036.t1 [Rhizophagus clarus]|nr:hypothetical protein RCL_jg17036.t1 [Rhizophagus clarus]
MKILEIKIFQVEASKLKQSSPTGSVVYWFTITRVKSVEVIINKYYISFLAKNWCDIMDLIFLRHRNIPLYCNDTIVLVTCRCIVDQIDLFNLINT